jgi:hypothetical protein
VIQFHLDDGDPGRLDLVIQFESDLEEWLAADSEIDGHDAGSGEMNIFVHTNDPRRPFNSCRSCFRASELWRTATVPGYRHFSEDEYTPIWPPGLPNFDVV